MKKLIKPLGFLVILILFCSVASRALTRGETLEEYAQNNPDIAYATPDKTTTPTPVADLSDSETADLPGQENGSDRSTDVIPSPSEATPSSSAPESPNAPKPSEVSSKEPEPSETSSEESDAKDADVTPKPEDPRARFYYEPLSEEVKNRIIGISYPVTQAQSESLAVPAVNMIDSEENIAISYDDLRYLSVLYYDFNGEVKQGELICNKGIAQDLLEIFYELYLNEYQIEKIKLIDEYNGDDTASMLDNNTSCFNYRVVDGTTSLSKHAIGCAIDINPFYNPYIVFNKDGSGKDYISPEGSEIYADRSQDFPYKIDENDLCYKLFKEHGFTWGGDWNSCKDYQHFQKVVE